MIGLNGRKRARSLAALAAALAVVAGGVGTAGGATPPTDDACGALASGGPSCDTEYTPVAKSTALWSQIGGAVHPSAPSDEAAHYDPRTDSPTSVTDNFYAVAFRNELHGLIAGAECNDAPPPGVSPDMPAARSTEAALDDYLEHCRRGPVIYTYSQVSAGVPGAWTKATVEGAGEPGFVGAVAWIGPEKALAVGGTGTYPVREPPAPAPGEPVGPDPAGAGRAWLFDPERYGDVSWHELKTSSQMGALTALAVSMSPTTQCGQEFDECGFAGGLRQIWTWRNGDFEPEPAASPADAATTVNGSDWPFRVRQIRFDEALNDAWAYAVTDGCCSADPTKNGGRVLTYDGRAGTWSAGRIYPTMSATALSLPDSYYGMGRVRHTNGSASAIAAAGGEVSPNDPPSRVVVWKPGGGVGGVPYEALDPMAGDIRLVAGDGSDDKRPPGIVAKHVSIGDRSVDPLVDWAVGELTSTGEAVAYTPKDRPRLAGDFDPRADPDAPEPLRCPAWKLIVWVGDPGVSEASTALTRCDQPDPAFVTGQEQSHNLYALSSYRLNAFQEIGSSGLGWAAGDRGALVRKGGSGSFSRDVEADPPALGTAAQAQLPDASPYEALGPSSASEDVGLVPALVAQPSSARSGPQLVAAGSPNAPHPGTQTVGTIVMSRDGDEGWALGPKLGYTGLDTALFHYSTGRWTACHPFGVALGSDTIVQSDPACASLASIKGGTSLKNLNFDITAAARVPNETSEDPDVADHFEVVAGGAAVDLGGNQLPLLLRYRDDRWQEDVEGMQQLGSLPSGAGSLVVRSIAFTGPNDGWLVGTDGDGSAGHTHVFHYVRYESDGAVVAKWVPCETAPATDPESCHDTNGLLALLDKAGDSPVGLTTAGDRVYLYGARAGTNDAGNSNLTTATRLAPATYPLILYRDTEGDWRSSDGGYDPKLAGATTDQQGAVYSLSVVKTAQGYSGWASGQFGTSPTDKARALGTTLLDGAAPLLHLDPEAANEVDRDQWKPESGGAASDYPSTAKGQILALASRDRSTSGPVFAAPTTDAYAPLYPMIMHDPSTPGWRVFPTPFSMTPRKFDALEMASVSALAPDNHGGFWMAAVPFLGDTTWFYHYTDRPPAPVFTEIGHPVRESATAASASPDGSFWVGTDSDALYRHDRMTGWNRVRIPGWDPGRFVTQGSSVYALAFGPEGEGVAVGRGGRIADISSRHVRLDDAAGIVCAAAGVAGPCSTGHDLRSAAVGQDGSVLVGGDRRALLYRPPGGDFSAITKPDAAVSATITGISYPVVGRAWLSTSSGEIFGGTRRGANWEWRRETLDPDGNTITADGRGNQTSVRAIAVRADGTGYAVGDNGLLLERTGDGDFPWRRVRSGYSENLSSIAMSPDGKGMLVGGDNGLVLTLLGGRLEIAHADDVYSPTWAPDFQSGDARTVGVAIAGGTQPDEVEAWAVTQLPYGSTTRHTPPPTPITILHYASDPDDPLLNPGQSVQPLPDAPAPHDGELSFAAFGRTDCQMETQSGTADVACPEPTGSNLVNDVLSQRVVHAITAASKRDGGPGFALFTGDVDDIAGNSTDETAHLPTDPSIVHHRFTELVNEPLDRAGVPLFAALGGQDYSHAEVCPPAVALLVCESTHRTRAGLNRPWQQAFAQAPAPFGDGDRATSAQGLTFEPVRSPARDGNAQTHYAFDVERGDDKVARVVVVDTSLKTLTDTAALQNPIEDQTIWLRSMLCRAGEATAATGRCSRGATEPAVVVSNTPTYSYGPGALTDTQSDGSSFETLLMQYGVSAVVSGRLGWNGRYWATAAGLHCPGPGGGYAADDEVPAPGDTCATQGAADSADANTAISKASNAVAGLSAPPGPSDDLAVTGRSVLPFVVAASAGGPFGPSGTDSGPASSGYWHGYSVVRVPADGSPGGLIVEQRPIFDWLSLRGATHVLRPGQRMALVGEGREAAGIDAPLQYNRIDSPAITHRYSLIEADPQRPYLPKVDPLSTEPNHYVQLPASIASIDAQTGLIAAGRASHPRTYALAVLSVGDLAAAYPVVFEPRRSFVQAPPPRLSLPSAPQVRVLGFTSQSLSTPTQGTPPPNPPTVNPILRIPPPPPLPALPPTAATPTAPPVPPAPPLPPGGHQPAPLTLTVTPVGVAVPPTTGVTAQPTPPVNPSPPSGARREAKQRQAATAKSEEGGGDNPAHGRADNADAPHSAPGSSMTRLAARKPEPHAFTRAQPHYGPGSPSRLVPSRSQASAWVTGLEWGGGVTGIALALALGWTTVWPTPRRRRPPVAAPATVRQRPPR